VKQFPYFIVLAFTYIFAYSMVPHKEDRFIMPVLPFLFLIAGEVINKLIKYHGGWVAKIMLVCAAYEIVTQVGFYYCENKASTPLLDIMSTDSRPDSIYFPNRYLAPVHSLIHSHQLKPRVGFFFHAYLNGNVGGHLYDWEGFNGWDSAW
jgi:hypothetical protein